MKLSTARRLVCMSYFTVDGLRPLLATATRIVWSGDTKRFLFPDGSVIESTKGNWKVVGMEKNPKLEAAVRRFGGFAKGGYGDPKVYANGEEIIGVVAPGAHSIDGRIFTTEEICKHFKVPFNQAEAVSKFQDMKSPTTKEQLLDWHVAELQKMLNEKDEQLDKANEAVMVVRLDWWAVALVALVLIAHYGFKVL